MKSFIHSTIRLVISLGKFAGSLADQAVENGLYTAPWEEDSGARDDRHGYIYGRL